MHNITVTLTALLLLQSSIHNESCPRFVKISFINETFDLDFKLNEKNLNLINIYGHYFN